MIPRHLTIVLQHASFTVPRPFRVPFGTTGCLILLSFPVVATLALIALASSETLKFSLLVNFVGIAIYSCKDLKRSSQQFRSCCPRYYSEIDVTEEQEDANIDQEEPLTFS